MPSFEEIFLGHVPADVIQAALAREGEEKFLFADPVLTQDVEGLRRLCELHHGLLFQLIQHQFGFGRKQLVPAISRLNQQHCGQLLTDVKRESWVLKQCEQHIRITEQNSLDFSRVPPKVALLGKLYRQMKKGGSIQALVHIVAAPATPVPVRRRIVTKSPPAPQSSSSVGASSPTPVAASASSSAAGQLPSIFRGVLGFKRRFGDVGSTTPAGTQGPAASPQTPAAASHAAIFGAGLESLEESDSEEDDHKETGPQEKIETGSQKPYKVYYDYGLSRLVRIYESGAIEAAIMTEGPNGFQVGTWLDGAVIESEEANELQMEGPIQKKPAKRLCPPAPPSVAATELDSDAEADLEVAGQSQPKLPVAKAASKAAAKVAAAAGTAAPKAAPKEGPKPEKPPPTTLADGSILYTTFAASKAYICVAQDAEATAKPLLVSLDKSSAEKFNKEPNVIMLAIHKQMVESGEVLTKEEAKALRDRLLREED